MLLINSEWSVINHFFTSQFQNLFLLLIIKKALPFCDWRNKKEKGETGEEDEWRVRRQIECMFFNLAVVLYNFFAKRLLISYKNLNIVAVTQLKHLANSYPILKMENISEVFLFSKYCLTLLCLLDYSFGENALNLWCDICIFSSFTSIQDYLDIVNLFKMTGPFFSLFFSSF